MITDASSVYARLSTFLAASTKRNVKVSNIAFYEVDPKSATERRLHDPHELESTRLKLQVFLDNGEIMTISFDFVDGTLRIDSNSLMHEKVGISCL